MRLRPRTSSRDYAGCVSPFITSVILLTFVLQTALLDAAAASSRPVFEIIMEAVMTIAQKAVAAPTSPRAFILKHSALFAAAALFVFVLSLTYGLDLSPGFF